MLKGRPRAGDEAAARTAKRPDEPVDRIVRRLAGVRFRRDQVIPKMIDRIKELFDVD